MQTAKPIRPTGKTVNTVAVFETQLDNYEMIHRGKVRDIYAIDSDHLLIITTDRLSAFDVILPEPIINKGIVLTQVSNFWFDKLDDIIANQISNIHLDQLQLSSAERHLLEGRTVIVKRLKALPIEAIVRGYLIGSGWKDYQQSGKVCGITLPTGLQLADQLPEAIYTPSSKAAVGEHDENIDFDKTVELIGADLANQVRDVSLKLYQTAAQYALKKGIIIADTKFEFGTNNEGQLVLIDEALTPDSSRFWSATSYRPGISPPSYDKQFIRDYLETLDWNKAAPAPHLPANIRQQSAEQYQQIAEKLLSTED
ncbi:MAG: phosphoribosylaminoimidazolesuccinocarboxamide synthase [Thiotrichaceae bacterium]|nr:phosphoribosylaminoimidazolesuccinocarboxamide synthase [Thiotrichaceae bacterium]